MNSFFNDFDACLNAQGNASATNAPVSEKITRFYQRVKSALPADTTFSSLFYRMSYDDFVAFLTRMNGILRDIPRNSTTW